jgi:hypothetical protein
LIRQLQKLKRGTSVVWQESGEPVERAEPIKLILEEEKPK